MTGDRSAGLRGRLPAKRGSEKLAIGWVHDYATAPLPPPVYPVDVTSGIRSWGMMGNGPDPSCTTHPHGVGDCTFAARYHLELATAAAGGEPMPAETSNELVAEYLRYDHGQDRGAVIADLLLTWYRQRKILAFAPVDHASRAACDSAMAAFHGLFAGVSLTPDADARFERGETWTAGQPDPREGHCILKVASDGHRHDTWVTWGALQRSTPGWTTACLEEAWAIITEEDAAAACLDIAALRADIDALDGTGGDDPRPPAAAVGPMHGLAGLVQHLASLIRDWLGSKGKP